MPSIPLWVLGKNFTSLTIRQQMVGADGTLTDGGAGATNILAFKDGFTFTNATVREQISPDNAMIVHNVILEDELSASVNLLLPNVGGDPHPVLTLFQSSDIYKLVFGFGSGGSAKTHTVYMGRGDMTITSTGKGAARIEFTLTSIDAGNDTWGIA